MNQYECNYVTNIGYNQGNHNVLFMKQYHFQLDEITQYHIKHVIFVLSCCCKSEGHACFAYIFIPFEVLHTNYMHDVKSCNTFSKPN